jgi:hypothetical protein
VEIHKPNPWHGLKEFLKEYVIIVIGVLTALGGEQAVEAMHTRHLARAAEVRVRDEAARSIANAEERIAVSPCADQRLEAVRIVLTTGGGDIPLLPELRPPPERAYFTAEWDSAVASGLHDHFPASQRQLLAIIAHQAELTANTQVREREEWERLSALTGFARKLDNATREQMLQTVVLTRRLNGDLTTLARQMVENGKRAGIKPLERDPDGTPSTRLTDIRKRGCPPWP